MATEISVTDAALLPVDPVRTAVALSYNEPGAIADRVLPPLPRLPQDQFWWREYAKADAYVVPDVSLGRTGEPAQVEFGGKRIEDRTEHHGLMDVVPVSDQDAAMSGGWSDPANVAAVNLRHLLALAREKRTADLVFSASSYSADYMTDLASANGGNDQFDEDGGDVLGVIEAARTAMVFPPNVAVIGQSAWSKLRLHPKVLKAVNRVSGADSGMASRMAVAELIEVDELLVGSVRIATSKRGNAVTTARVWGKHMALIHRGTLGAAQTMGDTGGMSGETLISSQDIPTFGFTAVYVEMMVHSMIATKRGIKGAHEIIARDSCKEVVAGGKAGFGYLIQNAVD